MTTTQPIKSFVSYSWTVEKDTKIVTELSKLCQERGIELIRDETAMKHGDQIHQFMEKLTGSEHIITIFSKPYFESQWCMFELLTIYQKGNFKERTHPIIADDCDLQNPSYRLSCSDFWAEKYNELNTSLKKYRPEKIINEFELLKLYKKIDENINELMNFSAGRLTIPLNQLKSKNYTQLLDNIAPLKKQKNNNICFYSDGPIVSNNLNKISISIDLDVDLGVFFDFKVFLSIKSKDIPLSEKNLLLKKVNTSAYKTSIEITPEKSVNALIKIEVKIISGMGVKYVLIGKTKCEIFDMKIPNYFLSENSNGVSEIKYKYICDSELEIKEKTKKPINISNFKEEKIKKYQNNTCAFFNIEKNVSDIFSCNKKFPELVLIPSGYMKLENKILTVDNSFYISKHPVTVKDYNYYLNDIGLYPLKKESDSIPVIDISWLDAIKYIEWISGKTNYKYNLPTEEQWEYAARQGCVYNNQVKNKGLINSYRPQENKIYSVNLFDEDLWELCGMYGNIWEWVDSKYKDELGERDNQKIIKGGSFTQKHINYSERDFLSFDKYDSDLGFRVIREV